MGLDRNTMSQDNVSCNIVWIADAAYTAAVSERRIFVLSSTGMAPALSASSHSLSEKPPSGPIMAVAELACARPFGFEAKVVPLTKPQ